MNLILAMIKSLFILLLFVSCTTKTDDKKENRTEEKNIKTADTLSEPVRVFIFYFF
ncbi:hypothetical protein ACE193_15490 [Bernardetia sp. OM2101]|uniref:hypothetical protein n=1 Tax=Bernardetia sp. OM2101 TaxID=3344876 RepID=UPI0035CEB228